MFSSAKIGARRSPRSLISYSTRGGTSAWYVRRINPSRSICRSRCVRTFGGMENLIPLAEQSLARAREDAAETAKKLAERFEATAA